MPFATIAATGHHQPERVLGNDELATMVDTNDEWIQRRTGVRERRIASADTQVADLATPAARAALAAAGLSGDDVDMVIVATCSARDRCPSVAAEVAGRLGITAAVSFDLNNACAGFCTALGMADAAVQSGAATTALVIGAEKMSDITDWTDRSSCILLGDGAGAVVVRKSAERGIFAPAWGTDATKREHVRIRGAWDAKFAQDGSEVFRWATSEMVAVAENAVRLAGFELSDIGAVVTHQANLRIIEPLVAKLGLDDAVVARDVTTSGNTSAASVPLALSKLIDEHLVDPGTPTLLLAFGGGLSWASQVVLAPGA